MYELEIYKFLTFFNTVGVIALAFYYLRYIRYSRDAIINLELITFDNLVKLAVLDSFDKMNRTRIKDLEKLNSIVIDETEYDIVGKNIVDTSTKNVFNPD